MASINKVILIGNLGRDPEVRYAPAVRAVYERYITALGGYHAAFSQLGQTQFPEAARKLAQAFRELRELASPLIVPKKIPALCVGLRNGVAAFFHTGKVDARNLP